MLPSRGGMDALRRTRSYGYDSTASFEDKTIPCQPISPRPLSSLSSGSSEKAADQQQDPYAHDPFSPLSDLPEERQWVLTARAVLVGISCGAIVNASNVYLGLKSGWTFGGHLFGAMAGFAVLKTCSALFAENFPILGGSFGPRENVIVQTAAVAAGGLSNVFVSAYPALYQLGLLESPERDFWRIVALTAVGGYFGFFFATPLRKFFIIYVARELRLVFPSASATALTIRSMHDAVRGEAFGKMKMKAMGIAFTSAITLRVVSQYALGILWEWHIFWWIHVWGHYKTLAVNPENYGWFLQLTPAFIGSGILVGLNVSLSFFAGSVISWGIIAPLLVHYKVAFGSPRQPEEYGLINFSSFSETFAGKETPSPRYWLLWPGVLAMIAIALTELLLQWRIIFFAVQATGRGLARGIYALSQRAGQDIKLLRSIATHETEDPVHDPAHPEDLPRTWMWAPGLLLTILCMCIVMSAQYAMPLGTTLLSILLAFFFSFLAIQCTGVTDITPLSAASDASQIILGAATHNAPQPIATAQRLNLLGGALANMGANQATDLTANFRTGFLLRTPPLQQWLAQGIGTLVAVFVAPGIFILFMRAYPCILRPEIEDCPFAYPSVAAWRAVAVAVTDPTFPIPASSAYFSIAFAGAGVLMVLVKHFLLRGSWEGARKWWPNGMCIALAFVLPQTYYGTAMAIGAVAAHFWQRSNPKHWEVYGYAVAAGLIAGEGIGGVINAVFQVAGIDGGRYGTAVACPISC